MLNQSITKLPAFLACLVLMVAGATWGAEWPQFRGPDEQGHVTTGTLPSKWSDTENITWNTPIPGLGWSSPVVDGNEIWLTTATDDGKSLRAIRISRETGAIEKNVEVFAVTSPLGIHSKNSHASPTPILTEGRVYVHFGTEGTACLDREGAVIWKNEELKYEHGHGPGGSPVLYENLLILSCDGTDIKFVVALDADTGKIRWKTPREGRMAYSTPLVTRAQGADQLISTGGDWVAAYEPLTGKEIWRSRYDGYSLVPKPVAGHGLVFVSSSYDNAVLYAIRPDGAGDITNSHVAWTMRKGAPHNPSPLLHGDELYVVSDAGIATCLDARSGKVHWQKRIPGHYSASPIENHDRLYFLNEEGETTILAADTKFRELGSNQVSGKTLASFAAAGSSLFLRTDTRLLRIDEPGS